MTRKKFVITTSLTEKESALISKLSSESGATVSSIVRGLIRTGLSSTKRLPKSALLIFLSSTGRASKVSDKVLKAFGEKFRK